MADLAVIVVSHGEPTRLRRCLLSLLQCTSGLSVDVVVVANGWIDEVAGLVKSQFPTVRLLACRNRGFGHANNLALRTCVGRHVLFCNPDVEVVDGHLRALVDWMDRHPRVGIVGTRQLGPDGKLQYTIRRFPHAIRAMAEAVGVEQTRVHGRWAGERERRPGLYNRETHCDWVLGSFFAVRRDTLEDTGPFDDAFFLFSEEVDLCRRAVNRGWEVAYSPMMSVVHYGECWEFTPVMQAQLTVARRRYARKHFSQVHRIVYETALALGYAVRAVVGGRRRDAAKAQRAASRAALWQLARLTPPPFGQLARVTSRSPPGPAIDELVEMSRRPARDVG